LPYRAYVFEGTRIDAVREMILANSEEDRRKALVKIKPYQKEDFKGIFKAMDGFPVTIRLLDPPLHEFIPHTDEDIENLLKPQAFLLTPLKRKL